MISIYSPNEDSYLMQNSLEKKIPEYLKKNPNLTMLEIGAGSGIHLQTALRLGIKKHNIFSCDINSSAVNHCKKLGFNCILSDLFSNINKKFNLIIFNPPYLPLDKREPEESRISTTGGKKGSEIINRFLKKAKNYLKKDGKIILLTSNLSKDINFLDYKKSLISNKKLFFEELSTWELNHN